MSQMHILNNLDFLKQLKTQENYKVMGMDVGTKTIGLAFFNSVAHVAVPYMTIRRKNNDIDIKTLHDIISKHALSGIVIGLALDLKGLEGKSALVARTLANDLIENIDNSNAIITFHDERFTTAMANTILKETGISRKKRNEVDNEVAASIILESLMNKINFI